MRHGMDDPDFEVMTLNKKVNVIAGEIIGILKHLSHDSQNKLDARLIADHMIKKNTIREILSSSSKGVNQGNQKTVQKLKELSHGVLNRLCEIMPPHLTDRINEIKYSLNDKIGTERPEDLLDSPVDIIKEYCSSIENRNRNLEQFIRNIMKYLDEAENYLLFSLSSHKQKFGIDSDFNEDLSNSMKMIVHNFDTLLDLSQIKSAVMSRMEVISASIIRKREQDVTILNEAEHIIEQMKDKINEIKCESESIHMHYDETEHESFRDDMTGLYNRNAFEHKMNEALSIYGRYRVPYSLILCDADSVKKIKDNFGLSAGNSALKKIALSLKKRLRESDFLCRLGGEEFAIILPHTNLKGATCAGEGVISSIQSAYILFKETSIPLSINLGISSFRTGDSRETVFERADKALYIAGRTGKSCARTEEDVINEGAILKQSALKI